jgi:hypothetical protein
MMMPDWHNADAGLIRHQLYQNDTNAWMPMPERTQLTNGRNAYSEIYFSPAFRTNPNDQQYQTDTDAWMPMPD